YDIGIADDNSLYISMEYIKDGDLKSRIGIPMDPAEALDILRQVARGLKIAHEHGIIHRDVKPANILFRDDHTPLLTDFGIAKKLDNDMSLTSTGIFLGSPNYVSPEQATGGDIDGRSDIYSLGCILYEMLTGEKPFKSETVFDVVMKHKSAPIPVLPDDLSQYQPLLEKMMAKIPRDRFADAGELITAIDRLVAIQPPATLDLDFSMTGDKVSQLSGKYGVRKTLLGLLVISALFFGSLQYVDIRLKSDDINLSQVTVSTTIAGNQAAGISTANLPGITSGDTATGQASDEVLNALMWLGRKSLDEYRLTYPPEDNAYYYFSRLLEINPQNREARAGLMEIADRYAILAEQSLVKNEHNKTEAYIQIGLKINPDNQTLLKLKKLNEETRTVSFADSMKRFFGGLFN
ncbi:MAG TPA: serine/threonine-protein kinase, partial [Gammaproteobacteria bacterium]|nr:serine/threonine-protein kinase [Gammaproteobacteria bacterium]